MNSKSELFIVAFVNISYLRYLNFKLPKNENLVFVQGQICQGK
jgi:hypothetical protein